MNNKKVVVALTGGGSGGHITPLLSLAHELKLLSPDCEIVYIGHKGDNFDSLNLPQHDFDFLAFINAGKFRRYHGESLISHLLDIKTILLNIRDLFRFMGSIGTAFKILSRTRVDVLFAKGGFVSVPVGIAARIKGIPIVTHDSDAIGGLANKIVGRWARVRATGMPVNNYKKGKTRLEYVGIPLDVKINEVTPSLQAKFKSELGLGDGAQLLLVGGASNGSDKINQLMLSVGQHLLESNLALHIIHFTGQQHLESVKMDYSLKLDETLLARVECFGFAPDFYKFSAAADLIISRAGATSIAEYALQAKACVIIPSPFLAGGHQLKNAEELVKAKAAVILDENIEPKKLEQVLRLLLADNHRRFELATNLHKLAKPGAAKKLAAIVLEQVKHA